MMQRGEEAEMRSVSSPLNKICRVSPQVQPNLPIAVICIL